MISIDMLTILLISIPAGFLGAMIGIGGAGIITPILVFFGVPVKYAIAAGMVTVIATSSGSAASYVKEGITNIKTGMYLEMFTITGAMVGAIITSLVAPRLLYFLFAAVLLTSFFGISSHSRRKKIEDEKRRKDGIQSPLNYSSSLPASSKIDPAASVRSNQNQNNSDEDNEDDRHIKQQSIQEKISHWLDLNGKYYDKAAHKQIHYRIERPVLGGVCMFGAGIAAGMLGIGAGAFKVSIHELILKMPTKVSSTTSNFIIGITALAGSSIYFSYGMLYLNLIVPMAVGTTIGSILGGRILNRVKDKNLRIVFLVTIAFLISQMIYRGITLPT